ncbi:fibronectin type III domain-containing protein [Kitasatospora sp. NPDC050543]|uniref:fibronectin type III domain-containing protein n=1 Tax=Kitasatospora sp. NPDC050543 TaxID=3364054 RepID=UPI0037A8F96D
MWVLALQEAGNEPSPCATQTDRVFPNPGIHEFVYQIDSADRGYVINIYWMDPGQRRTGLAIVSRSTAVNAVQLVVGNVPHRTTLGSAPTRNCRSAPPTTTRPSPRRSPPGAPSPPRSRWPTSTPPTAAIQPPAPASRRTTDCTPTPWASTASPARSAARCTARSASAAKTRENRRRCCPSASSPRPTCSSTAPSRESPSPGRRSSARTPTTSSGATTTGDPNAAWQPSSTPTNRFDLSWQFNGQPNEGHTYQVRVRAVAGNTADRRSDWSPPVGGTAHPTTAAPPETVTVTPDVGAINVTWTPATGPHADTITRYALWVYDQDTPLVWSTIHGYDPSTHSARVEGLTPGHHYVAFVCTWNAAGEGKPRIPDPVVVR